MKKRLTICLSALLVVGTLFNLSAKNENAAPVTIRMATGGVGTELSVTEEQAKLFMEKHKNINVEITPIPNSTTDKLAFFLQLLESKSSKVDIFQVDVTWVGELSENLINLSEYPGVSTLSSTMFPELVNNDTVQGKLVALPYFADVAFLLYRKDLLQKYNLQVPKTWKDLTKAAYTIQAGEHKAGNKDFVGFVWQGDAYDGLFCDALEWIYSNDGGTVIDKNGTVTINNPNAIEALALARNWIGTISPKGVLQMMEEQSRSVFQSGNAAFLRNWTYAYVLGEQKGSAVKGKIGIAVLPHGKLGKGVSTLGGWQLAVSKYSKNQKAAVEFIKFLASPEMQLYRAEKAGQIPTIVDLYTNSKNKATLAKAFPFVDTLYATLQNAVARPSSVLGKNYGKVSQMIIKSFYSILKDKNEDINFNLNKLSDNIKVVISPSLGGDSK